MSYDPDAVVRYFDAFGRSEYERHDTSPEQRIKLALHMRCLRTFLDPGSRVLEIGAGPGRFTEAMATLDCRITVVDVSPTQLRLNSERAQTEGYADAIDEWVLADIVDLSSLDAGAFDAVVAFGGPFSYVLNRRQEALDQCLDVLTPDGRILLSVMSKWGTIHAFLGGIHKLDKEEIDAVARTGDVTPATSPSSIEGGHFCHMFTASELEGFLTAAGLTLAFMGASNALSTTWSETLEDDDAFAKVLELEKEATRSRGALDMGTHIIAVAER
ncbi:MAG: class I SAM-dependent methyltransferase [Gemmatimonadetes bacterium]|nr:class I SAM-dependent methyltransferase [Gemmatimonadota bacterium]NNF11869.1 class I SAM-dependent methyltransferase [Gemmatimonadota bacterium]NNK64481.1 class I SAM-dependent methyltransferase [Gemmatimonadota bacterium]